MNLLNKNRFCISNNLGESAYFQKNVECTTNKNQGLAPLAIWDGLQVRSSAIFDEPEKCCIKNCYIVVSLNKVLIILMLGSLLEVHWNCTPFSTRALQARHLCWKGCNSNAPHAMNPAFTYYSTYFLPTYLPIIWGIIDSKIKNLDLLLSTSLPLTTLSL